MTAIVGACAGGAATPRGLLRSVLLLALVAGPAFAQTGGRVEGTVTETRTRRPIADATVRIQGTTLGARTNEQGRFVLVTVPAGAQRLEVRRIGYRSRTIPLAVRDGETATAAVELTEFAVSLDEVVVTGTASVTRAREVPTSTDVVSAEQIPTATTLMNPARAQYGMAALPATATATLADAWTTLRFDCAATVWLENRGLWDQRRWFAESGPAHSRPARLQ